MFNARLLGSLNDLMIDGTNHILEVSSRILTALYFANQTPDLRLNDKFLILLPEAF